MVPIPSRIAIKMLAAGLGALALSACGGGGGEDGGGASAGGGAPPPPATPTGAFRSEPLTAAFLSQTTFGPGPDEIDRLTGQSASQWFQDQTAMAPSYLQPHFDRHMSQVVDGGYSGFRVASPTLAFWRNAVGAPDQLRQRMAFALSQILVVSASSGDLRGRPEGICAVARKGWSTTRTCSSSMPSAITATCLKR